MIISLDSEVSCCTVFDTIEYVTLDNGPIAYTIRTLSPVFEENTSFYTAAEGCLRIVEYS